MPLPWALRAIRDGVVTSRWPRRRDEYFDQFPASVSVRPETAHVDRDDIAATKDRLRELCPSDALDVRDDVDGGARIVLDRGRCILCGRCVQRSPEEFVWKEGSATATRTRDGLVDGLAQSDDELQRVRAQLARRVRALGQSVHVRHVDAGSDGSDEAEVRALLNPVYDIHRLGIFISPSPRHADILLVTGIGSDGMRAPLMRTREAMPDPVVVIAAGADACGGGLIGEGYHSEGGVGRLLDVDVWVPGSPASPFSLLHGILVAIDRMTAADDIDDDASGRQVQP